MMLVNQEKRADERARSSAPVNQLRFAVRSLLAAAALSPAFAYAQEAASGAESNDGEELAEVIVTGIVGGSEQRKLDASFAISTVNAEEIQRLSPSSTADLLKSVPGVWAESAGGVSGANIMVRGLPGTSDAPWVSIQVDGAPIYPPSTLSFLENSTLFRLDDTIQRMEGLRGGPSPIFSQGQPGLTTNFILREGSDETKGSVRYSVSDYDLHRIDAVLSGAISENFYYMIGGYVSSSPGVRDAGFDSEKGRQFTINLTREFENGKIKVFHRVTDDHGTWYLPQDGSNRSLDADYTQVGPLNRQQIIEFSEPANDGTSTTRREQFDLGRGRGWDGSVSGASAVFDLGDTGITLSERMSLTDGDADTLGWVPDGSSSAVGSLTNSLGQTLDGSTPARTAHGAVNGRAIAASARAQLFGAWVVEKDISAFTNDISLAKSFGDKAKVTLGYYSSSFSVDEFWSLGNTKWLEQRSGGELIAEAACNGVNQRATDTCSGNFDVDAKGDQNSNAVYLAGELNVGPVRFDAGMRLGDYGAHYSADTGALDGVIDAFADTDESKTSYTVAANWSLSEHMGVFARVNEGYLEPFFDDFRNSSGLLNVNGLDLFQKVRQYEAGYKFDSGKWSLYATYFNNKVDGTPSGCVVGGTTACILQKNEAQGVELDGNFSVEGFGIHVNAAWQDTEITNGPNEGNEVGRQPPLQVRLSPSYTFDFGNERSASIYANYTWTDDRQSDDANTFTLPSYSKLDIGAQFDFDRLTLQIAGDNITDERGITEGDPRNPASPNVRYILPRSVKFTVGYRF